MIKEVEMGVKMRKTAIRGIARNSTVKTPEHSVRVSDRLVLLLVHTSTPRSLLFRSASGPTTTCRHGRLPDTAHNTYDHQSCSAPSLPPPIRFSVNGPNAHFPRNAVGHRRPSVPRLSLPSHGLCPHIRVTCSC